jgi:hypothetical protein
MRTHWILATILLFAAVAIGLSACVAGKAQVAQRGDWWLRSALVRGRQCLSQHPLFRATELRLDQIESSRWKRELPAISIILAAVIAPAGAHTVRKIRSAND